MNPSAAIIIIGNEILSGRTLDTNTQYIAQKLSLSGIKLIETRVIRDEISVIVKVVNSLRLNYDYVFITGGIGSTHDDVTREALADTFNVSLMLNNDALIDIEKYYFSKKIELNNARRRMAYLPTGAVLIPNPVSGAPGFNMENVFVFAGVPNIMQAMFEDILPMLKTGDIYYSQTVDIKIGEGQIADEYRLFQQRYPTIEMGSYPYKIDHQHRTELVLRSTNPQDLNLVCEELKEMFKQYI